MFNKIPFEIFKKNILNYLTTATNLCILKCVNKELEEYIITHSALVKKCYACNGNRFNVSSKCDLEGCMVQSLIHPYYRFVNGNKYYCSFRCVIH